jgi:hypothetical protein
MANNPKISGDQLALPRMLVPAGAALLLLFACHPAPTGSFGASGYRHDEYDYSVSFVSPASRELMGPDWRLDNYYLRRDVLTPKEGADYEATFYVDANGDGQADELGERLIYDLRFTHERSSAVIWLRTVPIEASLGSKDLRVLVRDFVSAMSGTHYETVQLKGKLVGVAQERTFAVAELESAPGTIAGQPAFRMSLQVVDVDQHQVAPGTHQRSVELVLIRTPFVVSGGSPGSHVAPPYRLPVLMLAGYAAHADDFEASHSDFTGLLERLTIARRRGVKFAPSTPAAGTTQPAIAQPVAAPAPQPPTPPAPPQPAPVDSITPPTPTAAPSLPAAEPSSTP